MIVLFKKLNCAVYSRKENKMFTLFELSYNENNGLTKYSIVHNGPIAYIETTPEVAEQIIKALNNSGLVTFKNN